MHLRLTTPSMVRHHRLRLLVRSTPTLIGCLLLVGRLMVMVVMEIRLRGGPNGRCRLLRSCIALLKGEVVVREGGVSVGLVGDVLLQLLDGVVRADRGGCVHGLRLLTGCWRVQDSLDVR